MQVSKLAYCRWRGDYVSDFGHSRAIGCCCSDEQSSILFQHILPKASGLGPTQAEGF
jgi:hypothetical protein